MSRASGPAPLEPSVSSQSDIDEIDSVIVPSHPAVPVPSAARPASPPRASIPVSSFPVPVAHSGPDPTRHEGIAQDGFGSGSVTLTEPVWDTVRRDADRIVSNLKLVVFPNPYREDRGTALRDWDLWGPFFFIVFLGLVLSWSATAGKSQVFSVAFAVLSAGAIVLTVNALLLGGHIIFFQSISLLGYCLFPLDVGAFICMLRVDVVTKIVVVAITLAWSSWAAYPLMSAAVVQGRKTLALYPVFLMYTSVGFLIIAVT